MRALLLVLHAIAYVSTNAFDLETLGIVAKIRDRMKGNKTSKMQKLLNRTKEDFNHMLGFRRTLRAGCRETIQSSSVLSPEQKTFLDKLESFQGETPRRKDSIEDVNMKSGIADVLFQGDMLLSKEQRDQMVTDNNGKRTKRQAYNAETYPARRWPYTIHYSLEDPLGEATKNSFVTAAELWMNNTCINFKKDENETADDLIIVFRGLGCWSDVGREYDWQFISLGYGCGTVGTAAHEIGHALGFWHTHSRHDRDEFVTILNESIAHDWEEEFAIESAITNNNYNLTYDYGSVMHYGSRSGGKNTTKETEGGKLTTMVPKDVLYMDTLGSHMIAFYDLLMMNLLYNCTELCKNESTPCQNGGFAHPRNCSKCICPSGYGGDFCNQRPPGCGNVLNATGNWTLLEQDLIKDLQNGTQEGSFRKCVFWVQAPKGEQVEVKILGLPHGFGTDGCTDGGVEIKTHSDQRLTGYRFCSQHYVNTTLTSNSSMVPVIFFVGSGIGESELIFESENGEYEVEGDEDDDEEEEDDDDDNEDDEDEQGDENGKKENNGDLEYLIKLKYRLLEVK